MFVECDHLHCPTPFTLLNVLWCDSRHATATAVFTSHYVTI